MVIYLGPSSISSAIPAPFLLCTCIYLPFTLYKGIHLSSNFILEIAVFLFNSKTHRRLEEMKQQLHQHLCKEKENCKSKYDIYYCGNSSFQQMHGNILSTLSSEDQH
ncbi:hypothetical protein DsansV1_C38g0235361 [Dioscorea sansibarensis]